MSNIQRTKERKVWMPERKYRGHRISNKKFYNSKAWKTLREIYLSAEPWCKECMIHDKLRDAYYVDHIIPINDGGDPLAMSNLQGLCKTCDAKKRGREAHNITGEGYQYPVK